MRIAPGFEVQRLLYARVQRWRVEMTAFDDGRASTPPFARDLRRTFRNLRQRFARLGDRVRAIATTRVLGPD